MQMLSTAGSPGANEGQATGGGSSKEDAQQSGNPSPVLARAPPANYLGGNECSSSSMPRRKLYQPRTPSNPRCALLVARHAARRARLRRIPHPRAAALATAASPLATEATLRHAPHIFTLAPPRRSSPLIPQRVLPQETASSLLQKALEDSGRLEKVGIRQPESFGAIWLARWPRCRVAALRLRGGAARGGRVVARNPTCAGRGT